MNFLEHFNRLIRFILLISAAILPMLYVLLHNLRKVWKYLIFSHTPAESKFFLPLVFTKMLLSAKGMRKNSILTSGGNKNTINHRLNNLGFALGINLPVILSNCYINILILIYYFSRRFSSGYEAKPIKWDSLNSIEN